MSRFEKKAVNQRWHMPSVTHSILAAIAHNRLKTLDSGQCSIGATYVYQS